MTFILRPKAYARSGGTVTHDDPFVFEVESDGDKRAMLWESAPGHWQIMRYRGDVVGDWEGAYESKERALAALEQLLLADRAATPPV